MECLGMYQGEKKLPTSKFKRGKVPKLLTRKTPRNTILMESVKYNTAIWKRFGELKIPLSEHGNTLPTDLGDIRQVCCEYINAFDVLLSQRDRQIIVATLRTVRNDLYIHLTYHLKELKRPLNTLISDLEKEGHFKTRRVKKTRQNKK
jgi:hypothetical protein